MFRIITFLGLLAAAGCAATDVAAPRYAAAGPTDLFVIGGQSNVPHRAGVYPFDRLRALGSDTVSLWSFAKRYYQRTGRKLTILSIRQSGSSQTAEATSRQRPPHEHWDTGGTLVPGSFAVMDSLLATGDYILRGILWSHGERESHFIPARIPDTRYREALETMIARFRRHYGPTLPFYIIRSGRADAGDSDGWRAVRRMQEAVADADPNTTVIYRRTVRFPDLGLMSNEIHYSAEGWRRIGRASADLVVP